jgi:hypothetical protein
MESTKSALYQHNGRWYRISAEPIIRLKNSQDAFDPMSLWKFREEDGFVGTWQDIETGRSGICPGPFYRYETAFDAVLGALPSVAG